jgi:hypothetical protein
MMRTSVNNEYRLKQSIPVKISGCFVSGRKATLYGKAIFWQSAAPFRAHSTILSDHLTSRFVFESEQWPIYPLLTE